MANHERTEKPTARRLEEARKKGQLPRSRDIVQLTSFAASIVALSYWGNSLMSLLQSELKRGLAHIGDAPLVMPGGSDLSATVMRLSGVLTLAVGPIAAAAIVGAVGSSLGMTRGLITAEALSLNFGRLNPAKGLKRFGGMGGYDLLKMTVLVTSIGLIATWATEDVIHDTPRLVHLPMMTAALSGWNVTSLMVRRMMIVLVVVAVADYAMQRHRFMVSQRMTKQEIKDEHKQTEGSPQVKGRIRRIQREMMRKRMLLATRRATVVVTNPTHFAVALEYHRGSMAAPVVVAKGRGLLAQRIKDIARDAGVPIVEQVALARALYKTAEVGETIPGDLFEAVAEVLAYLIRLKQLVL